jgi:hypothetical protein
MKEFAEYYCNSCMCQDDSCRLIEQARTWLRSRPLLSKKMLFEEAAEIYPGASRPFMMAWCDEFGGI